MIIVNLFAIVIGLLSLLAVTILGSIFPSLLGEHFGPAMLATASVLSLVSEIFGLKARMFVFIPVWLVGAAYAGYALHARWGVAGIAIAVLGTAGVFYGLFLVAKRLERREWEAVQKRLVETDLGRLQPSTPEFWRAIRSVFFVPAAMPNSREVCQHNLHVLSTILDRNAPLAETERASVASLVERLTEGATASEPIKFPQSLYTAVEEVISVRNKKPKPISGASAASSA